MLKIMLKIGIICCGNVKNECNCAFAGCLRCFNAKTAGFELYKNEEIQLVGITTCAGCPTIYAHEKILRKVKPLVELNKVDKIHLSSCMAKLCSFVKKFTKIINEAYPKVEVLEGTDAKPNAPLETMPKIFHRLLTNTDNDITEEFKKIMESARFKEIIKKEEEL
jgi:predicted metal-binding protein